MNSTLITPEEYFNSNELVIKKQYDALYDFFRNKKSAEKVAEDYGYTVKSLYSLTRDFRKHLKENSGEDFFFKNVVYGRKPNKDEGFKEFVVGTREDGGSCCSKNGV